jgi:hypothetical protein
MRRRFDSEAKNTRLDNLTTRPSVNDNLHHPSIADDRGPMKLIPWEDIWSTLRGARIRGHGEMMEVFYETLFKEALFDDNGAWSHDPSHRN